MDYRILNLGDRAITFEFGSVISRRVNHHVLGVHANLKESISNGLVKGILESVPTFRSLTVHFDPTILFPEEVVNLVAPYIEEGNSDLNPTTKWIFPVCYDDQYAPDLKEVAERTGLLKDEVVSIHQKTVYDVFMLGFLPGFAFMGLLDERLRLPRRSQPRTAVPKGSLAIADQLTAVYPSESPGGWHLIGRMPIDLFDARRKEPVLLKAGDQVCFRQVSVHEFEDIQQALAVGEYDYSSICQQKEVA